MVKLAYTLALGASARKGVRVRVPPWPLRAFLMKAIFICRSTVIVAREPLQSIDVLVEGRRFRCWRDYSNKEWSFLPPYGQVERDPAVCAMVIDNGSLPPYEEWEKMKDAIRPLLLAPLLAPLQALEEDQQLWQNIQSVDPFSRC